MGTHWYLGGEGRVELDVGYGDVDGGSCVKGGVSTGCANVCVRSLKLPTGTFDVRFGVWVFYYWGALLAFVSSRRNAISGKRSAALPT